MCGSVFQAAAAAAPKGKIMIGVLITTHGNLGNELIHAAESIKVARSVIWSALNRRRTWKT